MQYNMQKKISDLYLMNIISIHKSLPFLFIKNKEKKKKKKTELRELNTPRCKTH